MLLLPLCNHCQPLVARCAVDPVRHNRAASSTRQCTLPEPHTSLCLPLPLTPHTPQWFVYRQVGTTSVVNTVTLASQTGAPASLTASPPGGITSALKLVTQTSGDRAFAGFFYPPAGTLSQTTSPPSPPGMFGGVSERAAKGMDRVGASQPHPYPALRNGRNLQA